MDSVLRNTAGTVTAQLRNGDGTLVDADGTVVATVFNGAGQQLQTGNATHGTTGVYTFVVTPANAAQLDQHTVTWTGTLSGQAFTLTTQYEVVGANVFTIADLRAQDKALADVVRYPAERLRDAREAAIDRFTFAFQRAVRPTGRRAVLNGSGGLRLVLPDQDVTQLLSVTIDGGTGLVVADLTVGSDGAVWRNDGSVWPAGVQNVSVHYEYGVATVPMDVRRALLLLAVEYAVPNTIPARATGSSTDSGTVRYTLAGRDGPTGNPEVDAIGMDWGYRRPGVG